MIKALVGLILAFCFVPFAGWAQLDPSNKLLLGSGSSPKESGVESGRYQIRSSSKSSSSADSQMTIELKAKPGVVESRQKSKASSQTVQKINLDNPPLEDAAIEEPAAEAIVEKPLDPIPVPATEVEVKTEVTAEIKSPPPTPVEKVATIEPEDPPRPWYSVYTLDVGTGYLYNASKSDYSYRRYSTSAQQVSIGGTYALKDFEFMIFDGISLNYMTTLDGEVRARDSDSRIPVKIENTKIGFYEQVYFGTAGWTDNPMLEGGARYIENKTTFPKSTMERANLVNRGLEVYSKARMPKGEHYVSYFEIRYAPVLTSLEGGTGLSLDSGSRARTSLLGLQIGSEYFFGYGRQISWGLDYMVEKTRFSGQANQPDPNTGGNPENVSVTNSTLIINLSYRFGN